MNLKAINRLLRKKVGAANVPGRTDSVKVSENVRKQVLLYLAIRAEADGTEIFPTKQRIADELGLSKRAVQLAITTWLVPTPFGGPPVLHKDGEVMTRKGPADKYRIDMAALWNLPEIDGNEELVERTGFTSGVNDIHPTSECGSPQTENDIHPERPSEKPKKDLGRTKQVFSAKERRIEGFLEAFQIKEESRDSTQREYVAALDRGATESALYDAAFQYSGQVADGTKRPMDPATWLRRDEWRQQPRHGNRTPYHPGGIVRG